MSIFTPRVVYAPFEYDQAYMFWEQQQQSHWLHLEISMAGDVHDWKTVLSEAEKTVIGNTLKGFVQAEIFIGDYWTTKVQRWFKKPEIQMMAATFGSFENIHTAAYAYLNQTLGIEDFEAFMHEPAAKAKIDRLMAVKGKSHAEIAKSLAIFSAFNEGVNLFSSFAILLNFSRFNKMKGVGQIIAYSAVDESLHSDGGCWLFRTIIEENPEMFTDEFKADIYEAARQTVALEDSFIDMVFAMGPIEGIAPEDLKAFIRHRCNTKLQDLGLKSNWKNISKESLERMEWFDAILNGTAMQDFFAGRVTTYSKGVTIFDDLIFED